MKNLGIILSLSFIFLMAANWAGAQPMMQRGMGGPMMRMYDPKTAKNFGGTVTVVETLGSQMMHPMVIIKLKTPEGEYLVHVAPLWYFERQDFELKEGDNIEVFGSLVTQGNQKWIAAASITNAKTDQVLELRDKATGRPYWAGARRRHGGMMP